ncbi:putative lipid II flippase FtsW [Sinobaca sp. H24]|uniref:putative lipid II flippase FtsW n=1 Tax=Sinobaca sp. H24 TaxID=2923376 RepID=UPI0020795586|nr:putative lipid II flippase FtsW [Sinobaca sp. H24]
MQKYKNYDWWMIGAAFALAIFGLVMIYSASFPLAIDLYDNPAHFFQRQLIFFILGTLMFIFFMHFPFRRFQVFIPFLMLISIVSLTLVLIIGNEVNGATSWFNIGPFTVQPAEFVKIAVIIYLAYVYSKKQTYINRLVTGVLPPLVMIVVIFALIALQPDIGTAASIIMTTGVIVYLSGAKISHIAGLGAVAAVVIGILAAIEPYRVQRLTAFRDPFEVAEAASGSGYQLIQSYIAFAHGGLFGTGLGQSVQKMHFLPEPHTDFILAVVAEELGIFGIGFILLCLGIIAWRGSLIGIRNRSQFGTLLAFGIVFQLLSQAVINAGAATGLMPITGLTFPLMSYGGSSLLVTMILLGILANISKYTSLDRKKSAQESSAI